MQKSKKWTFIGLFVAVLFGAVIFITSKNSSEANVAVKPQAGYRIPSLALTTYPGNSSIHVAPNIHKPLFINFWASWCPPCQAEAPDLEKAYEKYGKQIQFIGVNLTNKDSLPDVQNFLKKYGIKYTNAVDQSGSATFNYQIVAIPTSIFVNRSGVIVDRYTGAISPEQLSADLEKILK